MTPAVLDATPNTFAERLFLRALRRKPLDKVVLRALMTSSRLLALTFGQQLMELRTSEDGLERALAGIDASAIQISLLQQQVELFGVRLDKVPPRKRPHYTPVQRFMILMQMQLAGMAQPEAAARFRVSVGTISDWNASANPDTKTVGSTVKPTPPVRRYNDTVQHLTQLMAGFGFTGYGDIARHLARAGWRVARTTVRRYVKAPRPPSPGSQGPEAPSRPVVARYPHHVWHLDLTEIPAFLGTAPRLLAVLLDSASRLTLTARLFLKKPNAEDMLAFVERAFARLGKPRYLIVDQDGCFTATAFKERIEAWRVRLRFCSADHHRANAKLERFWGTLKNTLLRLDPPVELLAPKELEAVIDRALRYYAFHRPHCGLDGATPAEAYHGLDPEHLTAEQPPRGRRGDPSVPLPATIEHFEGDPRLPFLRKAA
ncbi:MAG TPA: DDE-type integrase/transposase/recombinase [Vicinamibacteria bacterium]|nr:DDE-type integrase/transposase/recombinase [Vicinamibacteria bacterium]